MTYLGRALLLGLCFVWGVSALAVGDTAKATPTFSKEIVRIFQDRCQICHRPGVQFTPMPLVDYAGVRPWAKSIKKAVASRVMPPWHADSSVRDYTNDISLSEEEIDLIVRWVNAGAPRGNPADLPPQRAFEEGWQIGEPDVVVDMGRDFDVPAEGVVPYQYFSVKTDFGEDKWVEAMEARAGNLDVVHHIVMYVRNPREGMSAPDAGQFGGGLLGALSPGNTPSLYEAGEGKLIKQGATLIFNMHYNTSGTATTDRSYVGFKWHKKPVERQVITRGVANLRFAIPPNDSNYEIHSEYIFPKDSTLISLMPHMHYRGKDFIYIAHYPNGKKEVLLDVPNYKFDWQVYYYPKLRISMPAGTRLECIAHMDNSENNLLNPNPSDTVRFGEQTYEEMMIGWIDYTVDEEDLRFATAFSNAFEK